MRITLGPGARKEIRLSAVMLALAGLSVFAAMEFRAGPSGPGEPSAAAAASQRDEGTQEAPPAGARIRLGAHPRRLAAQAPAAAPRPAEAAPRAPGPEGSAEARPADGGPPTHEEPPFALGPPGTGIAVFPKPGSDPVKIGIVVPDDFDLPEGFVRHYQVTDDGVDLPPILMFHPDYEWVDEKGQPLEIPADRVVPQELAPPGLPVKLLEVPEAPAEPAP